MPSEELPDDNNVSPALLFSQALNEVMELDRLGLRCLRVTADGVLESTGVTIPTQAILMERSNPLRVMKYGDVLIDLSVDKGTIALRPLGWSKPLQTGNLLHFGSVGLPLIAIGDLYYTLSEPDAKVTVI